MVSGCHLTPVICVGLELTYLAQVEAEGLALSQDAVQRGLVQEPGEHGVRAMPPRDWPARSRAAERCPAVRDFAWLGRKPS
jgi:hypothetical protein